MNFCQLSSYTCFCILVWFSLVALVPELNFALLSDASNPPCILNFMLSIKDTGENVSIVIFVKLKASRVFLMLLIALTPRKLTSSSSIVDNSFIKRIAFQSVT